MNSSAQQQIKDLQFCPYEVLGLEPLSSPSQKDIQRAFRALAKVYHPDKNPSPAARETFERGKLASQVLLSEELRTAYDLYLSAKREQAERMRR
jgi:curved DNA-binding protein CbpA